ncbi:DUF3429 family protein [Saccharibacter sp. 17.LH.SD]|uniref:DUF3429 domain-containing protein n=1 Tax=Saccharibacter sp. 17.LH.SD TaxID=2689393 RepID=UPI00136C708C|nr:DUF3429 domain-containing protein [Saccharibacter sp. 17.LH.SD]MXV44242.1 DUF3429 family protein [Saccharibacter sp. 17.LH.SD]
MKPFPVTAAMFLLLGGLFGLSMGGWLFLAGVLTSLPHLSLILLAYGGCFLAFQGAIHWGLTAENPDIIPPQGMGPIERKRILLGSIFFLWGWVSLCVGLLYTPQSGYCMEIVGFVGGYALERVAARRGQLLSQGLLLIKAVFSFLMVLGLIFALISPQGRF